MSAYTVKQMQMTLGLMDSRDRPWQAFPITILTGAYIGYAVGSLLSRTPLLFGKRIQFQPEETDDSEKKTN